MARHNRLSEEVIKQMRDMEAAAIPRAEIARRLNLNNSTVTKRLGPVRQYGGLRVPRESSEK